MTQFQFCPKCGDQMQTFQYAVNSGVLLDRCPNRHGLWLDPGELEQVHVCYPPSQNTNPFKTSRQLKIVSPQAFT